jgi:N-methylhydantoinase A
MTLDHAAAYASIEAKIARPMGLSVEDAAVGVYRVAAAQIGDLIHEITVERGLDPRDFVLHSFGGSCGMLAAMFGAELNVKRIVVPYTASVNCAFGLVSADIVHEYSATKVLPLPVSPDTVNAIYVPMIEKALAQLAKESFSGDKVQLEWSVDLRYARQVHELTTPVKVSTPLDAGGMRQLVSDFEALYERKYGEGSAYREAGIEMTQFRLTARGLMQRPKLEALEPGGVDPAAARTGTRRIFVSAANGMAEGTIYDFEKLRPGNIVAGPAVIHTPITTIVIQAHQVGRLDGYRNVIIDRVQAV